MAFATTQDVEARLPGRTLTAAETTTVDALIEHATALIAVICGKDDDWVATYNPPRLVQFICADVALRGLNNPDAAAVTREQLGAYSYSVDYGKAQPGMALTEVEQRLIRRAVFGRTSASVMTGTIFPEVEEA